MPNGQQGNKRFLKSLLGSEYKIINRDMRIFKIPIKMLSMQLRMLKLLFWTLYGKFVSN